MNQMRLGGLRMPDKKQFECGIHDITYMAYSAGCPACEIQREVTQLRAAMKEVKNRLELFADENMRLKVQTDIVAAIREASLILDDNDLSFLKVVLYEWRDKKSIGLKTTHGKRKRGQRGNPPPNGFIAIPREGDPYGHLCTSMGGLAIAEYFDEACNTEGPAKAMAFLVKGMHSHLPGGTK